METLTPFLEHEMSNLPNETHGRARGDAAASYAGRCLPSRQKNAASYLAGETPGVMVFYAPESELPAAEQAMQRRARTAHRRAKDTAVQDDETVQRLLEWREQAPYG